MNNQLLERFLRYVKIDTESVPDVEQFPSSDKQKNLLKLLLDELKAMGVACRMDGKYGYVYASIPANTKGKYKLGLIAHVDTSSAVSGRDVKPIITENYDGKDVGDAVSHNVAIAPEGTGIYSYFVKAVDSDNYTTKASNTITVDLSQFVSGVENVIAESQWNVAVNGRTATYAGTPGAAVRLVSISGATIAETTADASGNATVEIPAAGVYLVATPQGTIKAVVR